MKQTFIAVLVVIGLIAVVKIYDASSATNIPIGTYTGPWKDGTFTGTANTNQYGNVQVAAVVSGGKITTVNFLQLPSDRAHSQDLSSYAQPILLQETISAQNAQVNAISGATLTSNS